ncbi:MAG TPA: hypothetical protein VF186_11225 [Gaiellaceae bacterium]
MTHVVVDEWEGGFGWVQDEFMRRASHALVVDGRVWLTDPVDDPELEKHVRALGEPAGVLQLFDHHARGCAAWAERLGVPLVRAWESAGGAPFETLPVAGLPFWREVALWEPRSRTLVCGDALGTADYFRAGVERLAVHPLLRLAPPRGLGAVEPERILVGHGAGVDEGATAALREALATARRRLPAAWANAARIGWAARRR